MRLIAKPMPCTRAGWAQYYADLYNKTGRPDCEHLALWYLLMHEAFGEKRSAY